MLLKLESIGIETQAFDFSIFSTHMGIYPFGLL